MTVKFSTKRIDSLRKLVDGIKEDANIVGDGHVQVDSETYYKNLPEGVTESQARDVNQYNHEYLRASTVAISEIAADEFNNKSDLSELTGVVEFYNKQNKTTIRVEKEKETKGPNSDTTKTRHLYTSIKSRIHGYGMDSLRRDISVAAKEYMDK